VVTYHCRGSDKGSGADVDMDVTHILTVRDGKVATMREYMSRAAALEAAGVAE
jgi:ketosteroid isomerase-like protein